MNWKTFGKAFAVGVVIAAVIVTGGAALVPIAAAASTAAIGATATAAIGTGLVVIGTTAAVAEVGKTGYELVTEKEFSFSGDGRQLSDEELSSKAGGTLGALVGGGVAAKGASKIANSKPVQKLANKAANKVGGMIKKPPTKSGALEGPKTTGSTQKLYHKGQLNNPNKPYLSTGKDRAAVNALERRGVVHEFEVPKARLNQMELEGTMRPLKDLDGVTGVLNEEVRFSQRVVAEVLKYKK